MKWIQGVLLDIAVTVCIAVATLQGAEWAKWVVWIYTPFMLVLKIAAYFGPSMVKKKRKDRPDEPPPWFHHLLYAINVLLLSVARWWLEAAGWLAIWIISYLTERKG